MTRQLLTERELVVAALLAHGCGNKTIARRLRLSPRTVEHHVERICRKLETPGRGGVHHACQDRGIALPEPG